MHPLNLTASVRYTITPDKHGVSLCIWESAHLTDTRIKPFLFKIRKRLSSDAEAQQVLSDYLVNLQ